MAGYIGKISAVVTANTTLLSRELLKSAQDANKFANSLKSSINRGADAASASIEKIFTPLQMLERKLQQAASRGLKLNMPSDKIRAFVSAAEQINKPLAESSKGFTKLGLDVQAALLPAMTGAQDAAIALNREISSTGSASATSFAQAKKGAEQFAAALDRVSEAQSIAKNVATGRELRFVSPQANAALLAAAKASEQAGQVPASSGVRARLAELNGLSQKIVVQLAKIETLQVAPKVDTKALEKAKERLDKLIAAAARARSKLGSELVTTRSPSGKDDLITYYRKLADAREQRLARERKAANDQLVVLSQEEAAYSRYYTAIVKFQQNLGKSRERTFLNAATGLTGGAINLDLDERVLNSYQQKIGVLKTLLSGLSSEEAAKATLSLQRLGNVANNAFGDGTIRSKAMRDALALVENQAIETAAAVLRIPTKQLAAQLRTAGDVGRRGVDKLQLGLQQAAFAIDDFFSVTGDFQQRIRAVGNNITQLGFVVGKTKGLFVSLGAVLSLQLLIQVYKWVNANVELRDRIKAANSEIAKQKQLVDALAKSYKALADSAKDAGASESGRTAAERRRQVQEIRRQEEEARRSRIAAVDPESNRLRTQINKLERENEKESRAGIAADRQRRIQILERQLADAERRAASQQTNAQDVAQAIGEARSGAAEALALAFVTQDIFIDSLSALSSTLPLTIPLSIESDRQRQAAMQQVRGAPLGDISTQEAQLAALNQAIEDLSAQTASRQRSPSFFRDPFGRLENQLDASIQELQRRAEIIRSAIKDQKSSEALIQFSETSFEIADLLERARSRLADSGREDTFLSATADEFAAERERLSQRAVEAREQGDLEFSAAVNQLAEKLERLAREFDTVALVTSAASTAIERLSGNLNQQVLQEAEQLADQARRDQNALVGRPGRGLGRENLAGFNGIPGIGVFNRQRTEQILRSARERAAQVEAENQAAVRNFREEAIAGRFGGALGEAFLERERLQAQIDAGGLDARAAEAVQDRINELDRLIQQQFEATPAGEAAVRRADQADIDFRSDVERRDAVLRGADALVTDGERAGFEAARRFNDISALFEAIPRTNTADARRQQARILEDAQRQVAPALFALTDSVANAVLQGPSRQALNASDISTSQGTAEFLRLLRGDDSSRDQNLIELQRQTEELRRLNATFDAGVAN